MLTVFKIRDDGFIEVEWFAGEELRRDALHQDCLTEMLRIASFADRRSVLPLEEGDWRSA